VHNMTILIKHNVIKSIDGKVKYKTFKDGGKEQFHLGVWVDGTERELDSISKVEYKLHPSFRKQIRSSENRNNNFSITFWTWGYFEIEVTIYYSSGESKTLRHYLEYELPEKAEDYIKV
jgi:transcription initiation factor IIF auxiliary subunit